MAGELELLDWRRRVAALYAGARLRAADTDTLGWFRAEKDHLFKDHPQSPLPPEARTGFSGLAYWPFDPSARVLARLAADDQPPPAAVPDSGHAGGADGGEDADAGEMRFSRLGYLEFELWGTACRLGAYWLHGYAGGLFVPFRDTTAGHQSYAAGRYLLDTIKSADLGSGPDGQSVVLDFNYAYHPSCAYDPRWVCPLAPPENRLAFAVRAGERLTGT